MSNDTTWKFKLTDYERDLLGKALAEVTYDPNGHCQYINDLRYIAMIYLPRRIIELLVRQKASLSPLPYFMIENLPTDAQILRVPLPSEACAGSKTSQISENLIIAISSLIGEPYSILFEGDEIVNNLIPSKAAVKEFTGLGSEVELDFHIENAALKSLSNHNFSPLGLLLTGVNFDPHGPATLVADGRAALALLSESDRAILAQERFVLKVPFRWREAFSEIGAATCATAIVREEGSYPDLAVAFYADIVTANDAEAAGALRRFYAAIKQVSISIQIKPGCLVYIDNRFALHSREAFKPTFDEQGRAKRWVQRVFVAPHLWHHRNLFRTKHRVFNPALKRA